MRNPLLIVMPTRLANQPARPRPKPISTYVHLYGTVCTIPLVTGWSHTDRGSDRPICQVQNIVLYRICMYHTIPVSSDEERQKLLSPAVHHIENILHESSPHQLPPLPFQERPSSKTLQRNARRKHQRISLCLSFL